MIKQNLNFNFLCALALSRPRVKTSFLTVALLVFFSPAALAQTDSDPTSEAREIPADFKSDGCSLFPDGNYCDCCVEHDKTYFFGGSLKERRQADKKLYKCVRAKKGFRHKIIAPLMFIGVRIGGAAWLPTPFRWGFGKSRLKKPKIKKPKIKKRFRRENRSEKTNDKL